MDAVTTMAGLMAPQAGGMAMDMMSMSAAPEGFHAWSPITTEHMHERRAGGMKMKRPREDRRLAPTGHGKERRSRTIFNLAQLNALERIFMDVEYPDGDLKAKIAERLEVDEGTVQIWFQNRRAKKKRLHRGQPSSDDQPKPAVSHSGFQPPHPQYLQHCPPVNDAGEIFPLDIDMYFRPCHSQEPQGGVVAAGQNVPPECASGPPWGWQQPPGVTVGEGISPLREYNREPSSHVPNISSQFVESNTTPICNVGSRTPIQPPITSAPNSPAPLPSPASSVQEGSGDLLDKIRKWPVKETPSSRSAFGKLDFPKLPRVCIRHDSSPGMIVSGFAQYSVYDKYNPHTIQTLRAKLMKKDRPRSPPPNQTCAAIPRSQRNELEHALMKHGLTETEDPVSDAGSRRRSGGNRSDEWSSTSEESSDSEGLAPPRRKRRVVRGPKGVPPNRSCKTVPASDRTLPFLVNSQRNVPIRSPASGYLLSNPSPRQRDRGMGVNGSESDWDTDSDDSSWAYFDQPPTKQVNKASSDISRILPTPTPKESSLEPSLEKHGPNSAPPVLAGTDPCNTESPLPLIENISSMVNPTESNNDEFSDIALAREFAEMLPSPFGCLLPGYEEKPLRADTSLSNNHKSEPNRRSRIQSDSALLTSHPESRTLLPVSGVVDDSDCNRARGSPSLARSDSTLSNISSLFSLPVSPTALVSAFSEDTPHLDPSCDTVSTSFIPTDISHRDTSTEHPVSIPTTQSTLGIPIPVSSQNIHHDTKQRPSNFVPGVSLESHVAGHINSATTTAVGHHVGSTHGVIRPIPTHPTQNAPRVLSPFQQQTPNAAMLTMPTIQIGHRPELYGNRNSFQSQNVRYNQPRMPFGVVQDKVPLALPGPQYHQRFPSGPPQHPSQDIHQGSVVHHQPPSGPQLPRRSIQTGGGVVHHPSAPVHQAAHNAQHRLATVNSPSPSPSPEPNLPPNQVCTAVPDAVSSQGLMARYLAWTQGKVFQE